MAQRSGGTRKTAGAKSPRSPARKGAPKQAMRKGTPKQAAGKPLAKQGTGKPGGVARSTGIELRIVVWQFVRIMVQLETVARARGRRDAPEVYLAWRPAWRELDQTLEQLGKTDANAFSDLMMNQEVVVSCRNREQLNEAMRAAENVASQLKAEIKASAGDAEHITDLRFEQSEMQSLARHLGRVGKARKHGSQRKPRSAQSKPGAKKPAAKKPARKKPAARKPAGKKSAAGKPGAKKSAGRRPAGKKPTGPRRAAGRSRPGKPL